MVTYLIAIFAVLIALIDFMLLYVGPSLGYPIATYWSMISFLLAAGFLFLLRDFFARDLKPINFLNRNYYFSFRVLFAIFVMIPLMFAMVKILLEYDKPNEEKNLAEADIAYIGRLAKIEHEDQTNSSSGLLYFEVLEKLKGKDEEFASIAEGGLTEPKACGFSLEAGDIFKLYLKKGFSKFYVLTCGSLKKIEPTSEEYKIYNQ